MTSLSLEKCVPLKSFFHQWEQIEVGGLFQKFLANVVDEVIIRNRIQPQQTSQQWRCGQARYHAAEELNVAAFLDACFSVLHVI